MMTANPLDFGRIVFYVREGQNNDVIHREIPCRRMRLPKKSAA